LSLGDVVIKLRRLLTSLETDDESVDNRLSVLQCIDFLERALR
jgi:hypothetical protein